MLRILLMFTEKTRIVYYLAAGKSRIPTYLANANERNSLRCTSSLAFHSLVITIDPVSIDSRGAALSSAFRFLNETWGQTLGNILVGAILGEEQSYIERED